VSKPNPFKDRKDRRKNSDQGNGAGTATLPGQATGLPVVPSKSVKDVSEQTTFAQGRAEKMLTFTDLPDPVETPNATGDLSEEEEGILSLCMQAFKQFEIAWWVTAKGMANVNARKLYRKTHPTFESFAQDVFNKSRPLAYEEMASYPIGELLSARADTPFDGDSNNVPARADTPSIGKKAAGALNPITKDYGPETSIAVHESIQDAAGKEVSVKALKAVITQLPRREDEEMTPEQLAARAREIATSTEPPASKTSGSPSALENLRTVSDALKSAHRALAPSKVAQARAAAPDEVARLLSETAGLATKIAERAKQN
jgi:hypothetical protein